MKQLYSIRNGFSPFLYCQNHFLNYPILQSHWNRPPKNRYRKEVKVPKLEQMESLAIAVTENLFNQRNAVSKGCTKNFFVFSPTWLNIRRMPDLCLCPGLFTTLSSAPSMKHVMCSVIHIDCEPYPQRLISSFANVSKIRRKIWASIISTVSFSYIADMWRRTRLYRQH